MNQAERKAGPGNSSPFSMILSLMLEPLHVTTPKMLQDVKLGYPYFTASLNGRAV